MIHAQLLKALLPPVSYDPAGANVSAQLAAEGASLDNALAAAAALPRGLSPLSALEWLADYERVYGLPGQCVSSERTLQERIADLGRALLERAGVSRGYYLRVAELLGYHINIVEYAPFGAGSHCGTTLTNGGWAFAWLVAAQAQTVRKFKAGRSAAGERLGIWGDEVLECVMRRLKPAHTVVLFSYGGENAPD